MSVFQGDGGLFVGDTGGGGVGPPGPQGSPGMQGSPGSQGAPGEDGLDGQNGEDGLVGATGQTGLQGALGPPGVDGLDGEDGLPGSSGQPGIQGLQGPMGPAGSMDAVDSNESPLDYAFSNHSTPTNRTQARPIASGYFIPHDVGDPATFTGYGIDDLNISKTVDILTTINFQIDNPDQLEETSLSVLVTPSEPWAVGSNITGVSDGNGGYINYLTTDLNKIFILVMGIYPPL